MVVHPYAPSPLPRSLSNPHPIPACHFFSSTNAEYSEIWFSTTPRNTKRETLAPWLLGGGKNDVDDDDDDQAVRGVCTEDHFVSLVSERMKIQRFLLSYE